MSAPGGIRRGRARWCIEGTPLEDELRAEGWTVIWRKGLFVDAYTLLMHQDVDGDPAPLEGPADAS